MPDWQEATFLETLAASKKEAQADMALSALIEQRSNDERLLRDWLLHHGSTIPDRPLLQKAASFMLWLLKERISTHWDHRMATHKALQGAAMQQQACRLVLDWVVARLNNAG